jgi:hydrogenase nickel incorporation protein HypA/HybF
MHERALAESLLRQVSAARDERRLNRVRSVTIQLGAFSGVEPVLLKSAFEEQSSQRLGAFTELQIETVELTAECEACTAHFEVVQFRFHCPHCGNEHVRITHGEELMLLSITADTRR